MVKVKSTKGGFVQVEIEGINAVVNRIQKNINSVLSSSELGLVRVGNYVQQEVRESIIGNRAETKSVDTGKLGNSIDIKLVKGFLSDSVIIFPKKIRYANSKTTTEDVANFLEYGTSKMKNPRRHFRNTRARVENKVVSEMKALINLSVK